MQIRAALKKSIRDGFREMTRFEWGLWLSSLALILLSFALSGFHDVLTLIGSVIGATSLIFYAKGHILGKLLMMAFTLFYGGISFFQRYYGEMITYLCMTLPMEIVSTVEWMKHPFRETAEVEISTLTKKKVVAAVLLTAAVTTGFHFLLKALGNAALTVSTISIATSFISSCMTYFRSPYYALGFAANDLVLVTLWVIASMQDLSSLPMVACFATFFFNDIYAFYNWRRIRRRQAAIVAADAAQKKE